MPNTIIKASAGSGKTFQLSNEFLRIVLRSDGGHIGEKISSILASTFTRKAAGEILDRILTRLADAALDPNQQDTFAQQIGLTINDPKKRTEFLQNTTAEIAKNLYRLRICTLDAFFNKIAASFAMELAMPPGWSIIDETEYHRLIHEAVQEVCEESQKNEVRKLLYLLQKGEQKFSVTQEIIKLAKDFLPLVRSTDAEQWDHSTPDKLGPLTHGKMTEESLEQYLAPFLTDAEFCRSILPQVVDKENKGKMKPDSRFASALDKFIKAAQTQNWESMFASGFGSKFVLDEHTFYGKPIEPQLYDSLYPIFRHAKAVWAEIIIHQTIATRSLLDLVWNKLETRLQQAGGFQFSDITFGLGEMFERQPDVLPQRLIAHRMDAPTKHLLLDEFQDTSLAQWSILKPFVQSVIKGTDLSFFCVGDLKQAIYGWRGGIAEIFETVNDYLKSEGADEPKTPVMNETRRNSQPVINAVNKVFVNIQANTVINNLSEEAAKKWQEWFGNQNHETLSPSKEKGYCILESVSIEEVSSTKEDEEDTAQIDTENPFWKYTLDRIQRLHQKHPNRSIGILFRAKHDISAVLKGLKERNVEASDEGGVPLTDSAAVQHILSVMTLIDHPGDTIARFHLANGPLKNILALQDYKSDTEAEFIALQWRKKLLVQGYGKTVKELMSAQTPCAPKEMQRLEKLLELAYQFEERAIGTRTRQFIESVNATRMTTPSAAMVRVMTIHGAKGLEFDIVVLPDLEKDLVARTKPKVVVSKESPAAPVNFVLRWVPQELQPLLPVTYPQAFAQWKEEQVKESLAILYVAMTRARYELVLLVRETNRTQGTFANVLREGLQSAVSEEKTHILYQNGNEDWDDEVKIEPVERQILKWYALAERTQQRNLPRVTPSGLEPKFVYRHTKISEQEQTVAATSDDAALRGTAIHACFAQVQWLENVQWNEAELLKIVNQALLGRQGNVDPQGIVNDFYSMCERSEVRKSILRSSYPAEEEITVETERRFAVHWKEKILRGAMDRLVIRRRGNDVTAVEIIDFKTDQRPEGQTEAAFLAERQETYRPQMEAYREAAAKMYPNVQEITTKLVFASGNCVG